MPRSSLKLSAALITAGLAALAAPPSARAQSDQEPMTLYRNGYWEAFYAPRPHACGLSTLFDGRATGSDGAMMIKHFVGRPGLTIQIFKNGWVFPAGNTSVPLAMGFDASEVWTANGIGYNAESGTPVVEFLLSGEQSVKFVDWFAGSKAMWVRFGEGTEPQWTARLAGSRAVGDAFLRCVLAFEPKVATQPYGGAKPSQPYAQKPAPTQPFGKPPINATPSRASGDGI